MLMKKCKKYKTHLCPFDDSDQGPPFAGSVDSCEHFKRSVFCPFFKDMKNAPEVYQRNTIYLQGGKNQMNFKAASHRGKSPSGLHVLISKTLTSLFG